MLLRLGAIVLLAVVTSSARAQVKYDVISDDANSRLAALSVGGFIDSDAQHRTDIGLSFLLDAEIPNLPLEITLGQLISLGSDHRSDHALSRSDNEYIPFSNTEFICSYWFSEKTEERELEVHLATSSGYRRQTRYVTYVPGERRDRFNARLGFIRNTRGITNYNTDNRLALSDGTEFLVDQGTTTDQLVYTPTRQLNLVFGASHRRSSSLILEVEGYGKRYASRDITYYVDVIVAMASDIQKLSYNGQLYDLTEGSEAVDFRAFGFRAGVKYYTGRKLGLATILELGSTPGFSNSGLYGRLGLMLNGALVRK